MENFGFKPATSHIQTRWAQGRLKLLDNNKKNYEYTNHC